MGPSKLVSDTLPLGLPGTPEFEVLNPVVRPVSIEVVYLFMAEQVAPQMRLHDNAVLPFALASTRCGSTVDVSSVIKSPSARIAWRSSQLRSTLCSLVVHVAHALSEKLPVAVFNLTSSHSPILSHKGKW